MTGQSLLTIAGDPACGVTSNPADNSTLVPRSLVGEAENQDGGWFWLEPQQKNRLNYGDFIITMLRRGVMATLETLTFDNLALRSLPIDKETHNVIRQVEGACFTLVDPTPVRNPTLVSYSLNALSLLDLPQSEVTRPEFVQYMSGNKLLRGSQTAAHCYCGHQQGYFSGQLGDGAAM